MAMSVGEPSKSVVRCISHMVWRRLRIVADTSITALHFIFLSVQGRGDDNLHQFHIYGGDYGISREGGIGSIVLGAPTAGARLFSVWPGVHINGSFRPSIDILPVRGE